MLSAGHSVRCSSRREWSRRWVEGVAIVVAIVVVVAAGEIRVEESNVGGERCGRCDSVRDGFLPYVLSSSQPEAPQAGRHPAVREGIGNRLASRRTTDDASRQRLPRLLSSYISLSSFLFSSLCRRAVFLVPRPFVHHWRLPWCNVLTLHDSTPGHTVLLSIFHVGGELRSET